MPQINNPIIHSHKLAFFCMPKCANSSIKQSIRIAVEPKVFKGVDKRRIRKVIRDHGEPFVYEDKYAIEKYKEKDYLTIAVIRNPYERAMSIWENKIPVNKNSNPRWPRLGFWAGMTFEEFVDQILKVPDEKADIHFKSQSYLMAIENKIVPQYVYKFENLSGAWKDIQSKVYTFCKLELPDMPHYNASRKNRRPDLTKIPETKEKIYQRYKKDFEILDYESI